MSPRATYAKSYWFGLYCSAENSRVSYAANEGYATLSIDRLGNGQSSKPDALTAQIPLKVEILHLIIDAARSGSLPLPAPYTGNSFNKTIVVGHSLGSVVNSLNWRYPAGADATLLTDYAPFYPFQLVGFFIESRLAFAPGLLIGYLEFSSQPDVLWLFYSEGLYDQGLASYDWNHRGTVTLGEAAMGVTGSQTAGEYEGPVMVITGLHDATFCSILTLDLGLPLLELGGTVMCDTDAGGVVPSTQSLYPRARSFEFFYPNAGHCWHLHYVAEEGFTAALGGCIMRDFKLSEDISVSLLCNEVWGRIMNAFVGNM
jgi:pimeloyl-ACP methyl ester carboxylesterase